MKILMVSEDIPHPNLGGLGKHALALATALNRRGHEVDLLGNADCPIKAHPDQAGLGRFFGAISGHARGWKSQALGMYTPMRVSLNGQNIARAILGRAEGYDIIHYHGHLPWVASQIPSQICFIQTRHDQGGDCMINTRFLSSGERCGSVAPAACAGCATSQPNVIQKLVSSHTVQLMRRQTMSGYERHDTIFVSKFLQDAFARISGNQPHGVVLHNAVDAEALETALRLPSSIEPPNSETINIFSAGAIAAHKGYGPLLSELRKCPLPKATQFSIAGAGPVLNDLQAIAKEASVRLLGWRGYEDVTHMVAASDAVIVPSVWDEPCATTILEALALGRPVYALDRGGSSELQRYTTAGGAKLHLFPDLGALVSALRNDIKKLSVATSVVSDFGATMYALAARVEAHYEHLLNIKRGRVL